MNTMRLFPTSAILTLLLLLVSRTNAASFLHNELRADATPEVASPLLLAREAKGEEAGRPAAAPLRSRYKFTGYNLENCSASGENSPCVFPRLCQKGEIPKSCSILDSDCLACEESDTDCFCVNPDPETSRCNCKDPGCEDGEFCATPFKFSTGNSLCISLVELEYFDPIRCQCLSREKCFTDRDSCSCVGDRECGIEDGASGFKGCDFTQVGNCTCLKPSPEARKCDCEGGCIEGEKCIVDKNEAEDDPTQGECFSEIAYQTSFNQEKFQPIYCPTPEPTLGPRPNNPIPQSPIPEKTPDPSPSSQSPLPRPVNAGTQRRSDSCIEVSMLSSFASHELVFEEHREAHMLCDKSGSCATRGHIVHYKGSGMMMGSYCQVVGCEERIGMVNSPKYRRGMRVGSRTEGLAFTGLAARYESRGEEAVLSAAVKMGL